MCSCFVLQNDSFFIGGLLRIGYKIENVSIKPRSPAQPPWVNGGHLTAHCPRAGSTLSVPYVLFLVVLFSVCCSLFWEFASFSFSSHMCSVVWASFTSWFFFQFLIIYLSGVCSPKWSYRSLVWTCFDI